MRTECQEYKDSTYAEALAAGCDCIQLKYDGWWTNSVLQNYTCQTFSKTQRLVNEFPYEHSDSSLVIGEYMHGTQWAQDPARKGHYFIFDCWYMSNTDLCRTPYRDRYALLKTMFRGGLLPARFDLVANYPIASFPELWQRFVLNGDYEGIVFRNSRDIVNTCILRQKLRITRDLKIIGFIEGQEGKHLGRLGAVIGQTKNGVAVDVGGGFSDVERDHIWANQSAYLGRWFEVEAWKEFKSGSLRNPNFLRWRDDLTAP